MYHLYPPKGKNEQTNQNDSLGEFFNDPIFNIMHEDTRPSHLIQNPSPRLPSGPTNQNDPSSQKGTPQWAAMLALGHYPSTKQNSLPSSFYDDLYCTSKNPIELLLTIKPTDPSDNLMIAIARLANHDLQDFTANHVQMISRMKVNPHTACVWANTYHHVKSLMGQEPFENILKSDRFQNEFAVMSMFYVLSKKCNPAKPPQMTEQEQTELRQLIETSINFTNAIKGLSFQNNSLQHFWNLVRQYDSTAKETPVPKKQKLNK